MLETIMQKTWKMIPTWSQNGHQNPSNKHETTIQKNITKNHAKMKRQKAIRSEGRGGANRPGVSEEVSSSSGDSRSRLPLASNILQKTNTRQTKIKQPRTSNSQLARTWRAGRHGADLYIYISKCLRQNSARGRREGLVQMGVPTMRVRAESVPTFNFLQKWFRTLAKGETKSNKNNIFEEV